MPCERRRARRRSGMAERTEVPRVRSGTRWDVARSNADDFTCSRSAPSTSPRGFRTARTNSCPTPGSCWAVIALMSVLPESPRGRPDAQAASGSEVPWARVALFGTASDLKTALDAGLDPNSKTERGTTPLMMAAPDAEKVRLLVARGADVKSRGAAGTDALTIAAAHYGTTTSLRALLEAGAEAQSSEPRRHSPLQYAAMSGDIESVRLLLARARRHHAEAVSESVTFGHPASCRRSSTPEPTSRSPRGRESTCFIGR